MQADKRDWPEGDAKPFTPKPMIQEFIVKAPTRRNKKGRA